MNKAKLFVLILTMVISGLCGTDALAQTVVKRGEIAEISNAGNGISWFIKMPHESATLTVSAPNGKIFRSEFIAGSIPSFSLIADRGEYYGDGIFNYEIVLAPVLSPGVQKELAEARRNGSDKDVLADLIRRGLMPEAPVMSGTFKVLNGNIITGGETEAEPDGKTQNKAANEVAVNGARTGKSVNEMQSANGTGTDDQTIPDDLIVQGSICVGFDCVTDENFGFDTIRLKENNLRIKFEDTSVGAGFATNDWQITANDSANGGAEKFSIEDITGAKVPFTLSAGAPTNSFFLSSTGRIGLRTSTPVLDLHFLTTNTPSLRLEQNNAGGFTAQTWDIGGNEANFFIRDLTGGSKLPFRIRPGAPTSSIDIASTGDVGIGTASPDGPLDVTRGSDQLLLLNSDGKLTVNSSVEVKSGGIIFADGTVQATAATGGGGGGGSFLGQNFSTQLIGGDSRVLPIFVGSATVDPHTNYLGVVSGGGSVLSRFSIAPSPNLTDATAAFVVYKIRFRDSDGTGNAAKVRVGVYASNITTGVRTDDVFFNSNAEAATGTGFAVATICRAVDSTFFNFAENSTWLEVRLTTTSAAGSQADLGQIQIYKSSTCP